MHGDLTGLGLEHLAGDTDDIADVVFLEELIALLADRIAGDICLDAALEILHIAERRLAHDALEHHSAGDTHRLALERVIVALDIHAVVGLIKFSDDKGILAHLLQEGELLSSEFQNFI